MISLHPPFTIHQYDIVDSTNDRLRAMTEAAEFTCVTAGEQTAGRGRRDRSWHSVPGAGLYLSILLRPRLLPEKLPLISIMTAVALTETVAGIAPELRAQIDIKWPNDVLINGHKLGGILIESFMVTGEAARMIIGIGTNLNHEEFPPELREVATSLFLESGRRFDLVEFRNCLLDRISWWYETLCSQREAKVLRRWQELSSYATGKPVTVIFEQQSISGITSGLTDQGGLRIELANGEMRTVLAGEIVHLRS